MEQRQTCRIQAEQEKVQQTRGLVKLCCVGLLAQYISILCMLNLLGCYVSILIWLLVCAGEWCDQENGMNHLSFRLIYLENRAPPPHKHMSCSRRCSISIRAQRSRSANRWRKSYKTWMRRCKIWGLKRRICFRCVCAKVLTCIIYYFNKSIQASSSFL